MYVYISTPAGSSGRGVTPACEGEEEKRQNAISYQERTAKYIYITDSHLCRSFPVHTGRNHWLSDRGDAPAWIGVD